jgi:SAM-dependent methyltransferase
MTFKQKIQKRYTGRQGKDYHQTKRSIPDIAYPWVAKLRANKISPYISVNDTVLEYGVGSGWNLAEINCKKRLGFDLSEHLEPILRSHDIEFIKETTSIVGSSIDVVICHHVLEHTPNPPETITEIKRLLNPGGKLLLFVPFEKERRYRRYDPTEPNHHLYSWNVQTLGNLVEDMGFKVFKAGIHKFGYDRFAAIWSARFHLGQPGFTLIRTLLHLLFPALEVYIVAQKD